MAVQRASHTIDTPPGTVWLLSSVTVTEAALPSAHGATRTVTGPDEADGETTTGATGAALVDGDGAVELAGARVEE
jgi:hypothetical protein